MNTSRNENDNAKINFWGLQVSCKTITPNLIILVLILLTFFVVVMALLKVYVFPLLVTLGSKKITASLSTKAKALIALFKRGVP